jgi:hypothetical protein
MKRMMINSKLIVVITAILLISCAFAQVGKTDLRGDELVKDSLKSQEVTEKGKPSYNKDYENFQEKIEDYQKNFVYRSSIKDDLTKLNSEQKENHLAQYRKKLMNILKKDEKSWSLNDESYLSTLYYHKININKLDEICSLFGLDVNELDPYNNYLSSEDIQKQKLLWRILSSDIIIEGNVIDIKKTNPLKGIYDEENNYYLEITLSLKRILYKNDTFYDSIKNVIKVYNTQLYVTGKIDYHRYYETKETCVFAFSKEFFDNIRNYRLDNTYRSDIKNILESNNCFPPGSIIQTSDYLKLDKYSLIKRFDKINDASNFKSRSYK